MNVERLTEIAEWLDRGAPERRVSGGVINGFDMESFYDDHAACGTTCCIAGAAVAFHKGYSALDAWNVDDIAQELLGLTREQAGELFFSGFGSTPQHAASVIRHLIATGTVDWNATREAV